MMSTERMDYLKPKFEAVHDLPAEEPAATTPTKSKPSKRNRRAHRPCPVAEACMHLIGEPETCMHCSHAEFAALHIDVS